jgi:RHS repeat-associated protein
VTYLHGDHLGSTSLTTNEAGAVVARVLYYPYGETRYTEGTLQTDYQYTGQRNEQGIGLYDYVARFYDPALGRFVSADTVVPNPANPQDLNRYAYVRNNPLSYTDPSGHCVKGDTNCEYEACVAAGNDPQICALETGGTPPGTGEDAASTSSLPPAIPRSSLPDMSDEDYALVELGRYAYALYWSDPDTYKHNRNIYEWAMIYASFYKYHQYATGDYSWNPEYPTYEPPLKESKHYANRALVDLPDLLWMAMMAAAAVKGGAGDVAAGVGVRQESDTRVCSFYNGMEVPASQAFDVAEDFLGEGYVYAGDGRYVSADGLRQVRMGVDDLGGIHAGGPHTNFEIREPIPGRPGHYSHTDTMHIYVR